MICCFCGTPISREEQTAIRLRLNSAQKDEDSGPTQNLFAHAHCFQRVLQPGVPFDSEVFIE